MDYLSHNIAVNLKRIRHSRGMSLDVVSEQCNGLMYMRLVLTPG